MSKKIKQQLSVFAGHYKKWQYISCHSLLSLVCCYITLSPIKSDMGQAVFILLCILSLYASQQLEKSWHTIKQIVTGKIQAVVLIFLCLYTLLSINGMFFLEDSYKNEFPFLISMYIPLSLVWIIPITCWIVSNTFNLFCSSLNKSNNVLTARQQIIGILILICYYSIWLYAFNPAITSSDSRFLFYKAHALGTETMADWHPPFYAMVLSIILKLYDSVSFCIIIQYSLFSIVFVRCLQFLSQMGIPKKIIWLFYIVIGFGFNNAILLNTLWIDIPYTICFLELTLLIVKAVLTNDETHSVKWRFSFIVACIGIALFRQNGFIIVCIFCCIFPLAFTRKTHRKMLVNSLIIFCSIFLIKGPIYDYYMVVSVPGLPYLALANDITSTYYAGDDVSDDVKEMAENIKSGYETLGYNPVYSIPNAEALADYTMPEFIKIYIQNFLSHPKTVLISFMKRTSFCWSICPPKGAYTRGAKYLGEFHYDESRYDYPYRVENKATMVLSDISQEITDFSLAYIFYWRTAIYFLALLYSLFILWLTAKKQLKYYMPFIPIFLSVLTLYAAAGWGDYRYCWPTYIIATFLIPYSVIAIQKIKRDAGKKKEEKNVYKKIS